MQPPNPLRHAWCDRLVQAVRAWRAEFARPWTLLPVRVFPPPVITAHRFSLSAAMRGSR